MAYELEVIARESGGESPYPPLLFVHGSCHAAWCWDERFLPFFAERGFDAFALSLRGHGASGGRAGLRWTPVAAYVDDVEHVAERLSRPPVVIGHSLGGYIVQRYLQRHDPPGAVLVAPAPRTGARRSSTRLALENPGLLLKVLLTREPLTLFATPERCRRFLFSADLPEADVRRYAARMEPESFRSWLEMLGPAPDAASIRGTPMLIVGGAGDRLVPEAALRATADDYGADLAMIPDMPHDLMLDVRWQEAAQAILTWLTRTLAPDPA